MALEGSHWPVIARASRQIHDRFQEHSLELSGHLEYRYTDMQV
jgi:hypothetical protein